MSSPSDSRGRVPARIAELRTAQPDLDALLDYCEELFAAQEETRESFRPDLDGLDGTLRRERASQGLPLLTPEDVRIDWGLFDGLLARIVSMSRRHGAILDINSLPPETESFAAWHQDLVAGFLRDEALLGKAAARAGLDVAIYSFLTHQALVPFLEAYADRLRTDADPSAWDRGSCPVCGGRPLMARLAEETGKRHLQCQLCRTEWPFKRVACPSCGNEDQQTLRLFQEEGDEIYRVEVCDRCKTYLKTVDARKAPGAVFLPLENMVTLYLDLVAEREGFHPAAGLLPPGAAVEA